MGETFLHIHVKQRFFPVKRKFLPNPKDIHSRSAVVTVVVVFYFDSEMTINPSIDLSKETGHKIMSIPYNIHPSRRFSSFFLREGKEITTEVVVSRNNKTATDRTFDLLFNAAKKTQKLSEERKKEP